MKCECICNCVADVEPRFAEVGFRLCNRCERLRATSIFHMRRPTAGRRSVTEMLNQRRKTPGTDEDDGQRVDKLPRRQGKPRLPKAHTEDTHEQLWEKVAQARIALNRERLASRRHPDQPTQPLEDSERPILGGEENSQPPTGETNDQ